MAGSVSRSASYPMSYDEDSGPSGRRRALVALQAIGGFMSRSAGRAPRPSGWALGGVVFAATVLTIVGFFQLADGLNAIINDDFYVVTRNYTFGLDVTVWGWIHLLIGLIMLAVALGLMGGSTWAAVGGIVIAGLSAIVSFFTIPYYPVWSVVVIALDVWVIWALTSHRSGLEET
jgi:hypothetical protein